MAKGSKKKTASTPMEGNGKKGPELDALKEFWQGMPEEAREELLRLAEEADSEDEFIRSVFVGDCPECASPETALAEGPDGEEDLTVGHCEACGYLWCLECDSRLSAGTRCGHWDVCEACSQVDEATGVCGISPDECDLIQDWLSRREHA
jgi:hypothetical protein